MRRSKARNSCAASSPRRVVACARNAARHSSTPGASRRRASNANTAVVDLATKQPTHAKMQTHKQAQSANSRVSMRKTGTPVSLCAPDKENQTQPARRSGAVDILWAVSGGGVGLVVRVRYFAPLNDIISRLLRALAPSYPRSSSIRSLAP